MPMAVHASDSLLPCKLWELPCINAALPERHSRMSCQIALPCRLDQTTLLEWMHENNTKDPSDQGEQLTLKTGQEARELARQLIEGDEWRHINMASGPFEWAAGHLGMPYKRALDVVVGQYAAIAAGPSDAFYKVAKATMHTLDDGTIIRIYTHPMTGDL